MRGVFGALGAYLILGLLVTPAGAALKEGRSVGICSDKMLVCAFMKDGTSAPTNECKAQSVGAIRILPGECDEED